MKTVSLETAAKLKANGFPQDTYFHYQRRWHNKPYEFNPGGTFETADKEAHFAAPSADEIIDILPRRVKASYGKGHLQIEKSGTKNYCIMYTFVKSLNSTKSLAEAAARMWLYLEENNLL